MITMTTVTLSVKQYEEDGVTHIDIEQTGTGGIKGSTERRTLDWNERETNSPIFGHIRGKSRWVSLSEIEDPFLKEGFEDSLSATEGAKVIHALAITTANSSIAQQIWGFEIIDGQRYYVRHVIVEKEKEGVRREVKLVYDWQGDKSKTATEEAEAPAEE